jgi:hypothetical protein
MANHSPALQPELPGETKPQDVLTFAEFSDRLATASFKYLAEEKADSRTIK